MFNFLLVLLIIYFVFVIFTRFIFPFLLKRFVRRVQKNIFDQNTDLKDQYENTKKNGEINVDYIPPKSKTNTDHVGEYVDYEELN